MIYDDSDSNCVLEQFEIQEPAELMAVLPRFLAQLSTDTDRLLLLRYGFDLDYSSIAAIFKVPATTLRSRCNRAAQDLLNQVGQYVEEELGVTPESETISEARGALKNCLNKHYYDLLFRLVFQQALRLDRQRLEILHLYYVQHETRENEAQIARSLQLAELEVSNGLVTGRQELAAAIASWIQNRLNVPPDSDSLNPLTDKITSFVEEWLPAICTISLTCQS